MKCHLSFKRAIQTIKDAEKEPIQQVGEHFDLWILDLMSFDDSGVTLWIPDADPPRRPM